MSATISRSFSSIVTSINRFFVHHKTYTAFLLVMTVAVVLFVAYSTPTTTQETYTVTLGSIKQYVKVSGQVQSSKDANLSFQTTGAAASVLVKEGDTVQQGQILATLSADDAQAALLQAQANLSSAEATLAQLQQGARREEVAIKQQAYDNTKSSLDQAYSSLPDAIQNVDAITADVVKNKFAAFFIVNNVGYQMSFSSCDQRLQSDIEMKRMTLESMLADFQTKSSVITAISSTQHIDIAFDAAYKAAFATNDLVNAISNLLLAPCSVGNSSLDGFRLTLSPVKVSMTALFSDITAKRSGLLIAKNAFNQASRDLDLIKAGTDPYRIKAQASAVSQAEAQVALAKSGLSKTIIVAPFTGTISNVNLSLGETVTLGKTVISMLATDGYEIEAKVPEIDIVKVKTGADVEVTLDAYGKGIVFPAKVTRINPTATIEGSVPVYKIILTFIGKDERIRQGMTANVQIVTESKSKVIVVPARFVKVTSPEEGSVILFAQGKEVIKTVRLGIRGADGLIEVTNGLFESDVVIPPTTTARQAQKQTK